MERRSADLPRHRRGITGAVGRIRRTAGGCTVRPARRRAGSPGSGSRPIRRPSPRLAKLRAITRTTCWPARPRPCSLPAPPDRVVATSKTFRTLARLAGAAPSSAGPRVRRDAQPDRTAAGHRAHLPNAVGRTVRPRRSQHGAGASDAGRRGRRGGGDGRDRSRPSSTCAHGRCARA